MKKRIGSLLLILALCFTLLPTAAFAAETMDTWDGTADTSWYDENETKFHLKAAKQLAGMAKLVNDNTANFKDKTVYLDNDLDLGGHEWISIGNGANTAWGSFQGIFDGQSHVVYNLYSHEGLKSENKDNNNNLYRNGLFGAIYNATVQNLGIENADIVIPMNDTSTYGKGILVDWMTNSTIKNCYTTGSITGGSYIEKFIGGIAGFLNGNNSISQCYSTAAITGNYDGEYYKEQEGGLEPMDCWDSLGGIVGASYTGQVTISDCWFGGEIVVNSIQAPVGGIIGFGQGVSMVNCLVATKGIGNDGLENTCWLGYVVNTDAKNCFWPADDRYGSNVSNEQNGNSAGTATNDFNSDDVLVGLQAKAGSDVEWVSGIGHPTFAWDDNNILADYTAVNEAIAAAEKFDKTLYSNYADVEAAINAVDRTKSKAEQAEVDAMAQAIEKAINALVRKSSGGDDSDPTYAIEVNKDIQNGEVTANRRYAERGDTVTITVKPDDGFKLDELTVIDKNGNELKLTDKGNGKYTFKMPAGKVTVSATFAAEKTAADYFADVPANSYYADAVLWAAKNGITGGIGNGLFGPNQPCTRAQIVTFLWRAAGSPEPKAMSSFADVSTDAYYAKAVAWAVENGITTGTGDGKFSPDATCTRAQSVTFLFRAIGKLVDSKAEFSDVLTDSYYANAVAWAVENGVTNGIGDGLFGPDNSCTRAQIVTFLFRAYQGK